jgi:DNA-binding CsgD family transcriptional regulator
LVLAEVAGALCNQTNASWASSQALLYAGAAQDRVAWLAALAESYALAVERYDLEKLAELDKSLELAASLKYHPAKLTSALAVRLAWNGDFAGAYDLLRSAADPVGNPRRAILRCAERALYAAGASVRDEAEEAIRDWQDQIGAFERPEAAYTRALVLSRIWAAMASLLLGRAAVANHALRDVEREARRIAPSLRALCNFGRATYIHVETGSAQGDMSRALESVREAGMGGYGRLLEQLPLPAAASSPRFGSLTRTEVRVLRLLAVGGSSKSIGAELERSPQTIDSHIKAVIRKLGCSGRQEAVGLARQHGII